MIILKRLTAFQTVITIIPIIISKKLMCRLSDIPVHYSQVKGLFLCDVHLSVLEKLEKPCTIIIGCSLVVTGTE